MSQTGIRSRSVIKEVTESENVLPLEYISTLYMQINTDEFTSWNDINTHKCTVWLTFHTHYSAIDMHDILSKFTHLFFMFLYLITPHNETCFTALYLVHQKKVILTKMLSLQSFWQKMVF